MESHAIFDLSAEDWLRRLKNEGSFILIIRTHTLSPFFSMKALVAEAILTQDLLHF